jgi:hypothetical protein
MGRFLKKRSTDFFRNCVFLCGEGSYNQFQQNVEICSFKSNSWSKKAPWLYMNWVEFTYDNTITNMKPSCIMKKKIFPIEYYLIQIK